MNRVVMVPHLSDTQIRRSIDSMESGTDGRLPQGVQYLANIGSVDVVDWQIDTQLVEVHLAHQ